MIAQTADADLSQLSAQTQFSESHLQRLFKKLLGITPRQYAEALRTQKFKTEVRQGKAVADAMYEAGYGSSSRLYEKAATQLGMTPATYRKGGKGMQINYTIAECSLGQLLVATTKVGICAVTLGDTAETLAQELRHEYPQAECTPDNTALNAT